MVDWAHVARFVRGVFRKSLGLKAVALVLAVALWWFVAGESKVQVGFVVPLEIRNVPPGLTITNKVERQVEVRLAGPPSLLGTLNPADISAAIDLAGANAGKKMVPLDDRSIKAPPGLKVQHVYPATIDVYLERLESRSLPVFVRFIGVSEARRRVSKIEILPSTLEVEALPDDFARLKSLPAPVLLPETGADSFTENVRVELREGHAKIVGNSIVRVTVHFRK
ncbi:MAG: CdaR family protein [Deltaproteobacteria bacterium]|nr:CdaR family protein [Candidatus Deferrimicrobiaceae bacterium]